MVITADSIEESFIPCWPWVQEQVALHANRMPGIRHMSRLAGFSDHYLDGDLEETLENGKHGATQRRS